MYVYVYIVYVFVYVRVRMYIFICVFSYVYTDFYLHTETVTDQNPDFGGITFGRDRLDIAECNLLDTAVYQLLKSSFCLFGKAL